MAIFLPAFAADSVFALPPLEDAEKVGVVTPSPVRPPNQTDQTFVVDSEPGELDTDCKQGSITFNIDVTRFVATLASNGTLAYPQGLIDNGFVGAYARLSFPSYDVDNPTTDDPTPEIDTVTFNGHPCGTQVNGSIVPRPLVGKTNRWVMQTFDIPIEWVRFADQSDFIHDNPPTPGRNTVQISINTLHSHINWCTAVDWARLDLPLMAPLVFIPGTNANMSAVPEDGCFPVMVAEMDRRKLPWFFVHFTNPNGTVEEHARALASSLEKLHFSLGVNGFHLVAHSKGGIDARAYLYEYHHTALIASADVLSLTTISTPHHGTVLADILSAVYNYDKVHGVGGDLPSLVFNMNIPAELDEHGFPVGPRPPAIFDMETVAMDDFNSDHPFPSDVRLYTFGADADWEDQDGKISLNEANGLRPLIPRTGTVDIKSDEATAMYHVNRDLAKIQVDVSVVRNGNDTTERYSISGRTPTSAPRANDCVVTFESSMYPGGEALPQHGANHSTIKDVSVLEAIFSLLRRDFQAKVPST